MSKGLSQIIPQKVIDQLSTITEANTPLRLAHFLAQTAHESANFSCIFENLNYSSDALCKIFPKHFTHEQSIYYARNPIQIANKVYANRMGNGNESSGEGYKYRGRGYLQLTGHDNYAAFSKYIGEDCVNNPDLIATKYPLASAGWFFNVNKVWTACDRSATPKDILAVTKLINGGIVGLADRTLRFKIIYDALK